MEYTNGLMLMDGIAQVDTNGYRKKAAWPVNIRQSATEGKKEGIRNGKKGVSSSERHNNPKPVCV